MTYPGKEAHYGFSALAWLGRSKRMSSVPHMLCILRRCSTVRINEETTMTFRVRKNVRTGSGKRAFSPHRTTRYRPTFDILEARCLLDGTTLGGGSLIQSILTPPAYSPIIEMAAGPAGDLWFRRLQDVPVSHIT